VNSIKLFATVSGIVAFVMFGVVAFAQVQSYGIDANINDAGMSAIKLTITFSQPEDHFDFDIIGRIQNFNSSSNAGPVNCVLDISGISSVNCSMALTEEKRTVEITFDTNDFVKTLDSKFYFDADLGLNQDVERVFTFVRLPEGMVLSSKQPSPGNFTSISDGRRIIITWMATNINSQSPLRYEILYERVQQPIWGQIRLRYIVVVGIVAVAAISFAYFRYFRKSEQLVLSVLDDYERKVMDIIVASEGIVNQKKVVQETNLSKAKISRVVKSLVNRGLVEVEHTGRTNRLKLVKKKFKI
jgi:hypothetical protein